MLLNTTKSLYKLINNNTITTTITITTNPNPNPNPALTLTRYTIKVYKVFVYNECLEMR